MNFSFVFSRAFLLSLIGAIGFALIAIWVGDKRIDNFDRMIISKIQGAESAGLTALMKLFTFIGSGVIVSVLAIAMLVVLIKLHERRLLLFYGGVLIGSALLNSVLKSIFHRLRPTLHRIIEVNGYSFPSGHSMAAFTFYGIITFLLWKHIPNVYARVALIAVGSILILAIGISRIYLGVHYPSDIVGGYLASGTWLAASIGLYQYILERRQRKIKVRA
ncbi:phosphatase PAP2 family protein [Paenibacillus sp. FJAT-27812]|uniref:phosphatase PAP2 family protein n=1 Tax=Paenibacillus sp. FJAT-27812 TaxID=1684143 RepID=UPI0006A7BF79|nr:phosphatase PAP2 family protein [Paenibacillus sp. FJAT-27812]